MGINYNKMFEEKSEEQSKVKTKGKITGLRATMAVVDEATTELTDKTSIGVIDYEVVRCTHLNFREKPDKNSDILCVLKSGDVIQVEVISDGWAHAYTSAGIEGYVLGDFIKGV